MARVVFIGWQPGVQTVSLAKLLRQELGVTLKLAIGYVDRIVAGEEVEVKVSTFAKAETLVVEASKLGAQAKIKRA